jgi:ABC-2 type transport system permease protein
MTLEASRTSATTAIAPVRVPVRGLAGDFRAVKVVWQRELIRFGHDRSRMIAALVQPLLFLFVLGTGLSSLVQPATPGDIDFRTFLFPGVLAMSVLFTAVFSGISIVWDREFGFLREMLVAPVRSGALIVGKCLGGATVATLQSIVLVALAPVVGVPYSVTLIAELIGLLFLVAFMITAVGLVLSVRIRQIQTAMPIVQMTITPMLFLSGAMFPLANLPGWLHVLTSLNPLTYAVGPLRAVVFDHLDLSASAREALDPGVSWFGWPAPIGLQVAMVAAMGAALVVVAITRFDRTE